MEHDQPHAGEHTLVDALDDLIPDLGMRQVSPPDQHVAAGQRGFAQTMFRFIQGRCVYLESLLVQSGGDRLMDAIGVDGSNRLVLLLVPELVPNQDADWVRHRTSLPNADLRSAKPGTQAASDRDWAFTTALMPRWNSA